MRTKNRGGSSDPFLHAALDLTICYPLGLTRGPIRNSRSSSDRGTSATRRSSAGRGRCVAHQRSARSTVQTDSMGTTSSRVLTAAALVGRRAGLPPGTP
jgi:hypothetical protein